MRYPNVDITQRICDADPDELLCALYNCWAEGQEEVEKEGISHQVVTGRRFMWKIQEAIELIRPGFTKEVEEAEVNRCLAL